MNGSVAAATRTLQSYSHNWVDAITTPQQAVPAQGEGLNAYD